MLHYSFYYVFTSLLFPKFTVEYRFGYAGNWWTVQLNETRSHTCISYQFPFLRFFSLVRKMCSTEIQLALADSPESVLLCSTARGKIISRNVIRSMTQDGFYVILRAFRLLALTVKNWMTTIKAICLTVRIMSLRSLALKWMWNESSLLGAFQLMILIPWSNF